MPSEVAMGVASPSPSPFSSLPTEFMVAKEGALEAVLPVRNLVPTRGGVASFIFPPAAVPAVPAAEAVAANGVEVITDGRGGEDDTGGSFSVVKVQ